MGIETAIIIGAAAVAGAAIASQNKPKLPDIPGAPTPPPQAQAAKTPSVQGIKRQNVGIEGGPGGVNNTLLTGPGGVSNDLLNLGKNTLLGA